MILARRLSSLGSTIREVRKDLRVPLPETQDLSWRRRLGRRFQYLFMKYRWKLVIGAILFYLIRDVTLYLVLPYLVATKLFGD